MRSHRAVVSIPRPTRSAFVHRIPACRAVLSLDDDILMPCSDVERAFALWRASPRQLVGWYPRLLQPAGGKDAEGPPVYQFEPAVFKQVGAAGFRHTCMLLAGKAWRWRRRLFRRRPSAWPCKIVPHVHRLLNRFAFRITVTTCHSAGPVQRNPGGRRLHGQRRPVPRLLVPPAGARSRSCG